MSIYHANMKSSLTNAIHIFKLRSLGAEETQHYIFKRGREEELRIIFGTLMQFLSNNSTIP